MVVHGVDRPQCLCVCVHVRVCVYVCVQDVKEMGGTIICGAPVRHVNQDENGVAVVSDIGT